MFFLIYRVVISREGEKGKQMGEKKNENKVRIWVSPGVAAQPFTSDTLQSPLPSRAEFKNANNFFFFFLNGCTFWPFTSRASFFIEVHSQNALSVCVLVYSTQNRIEQHVWDDIQTSEQQFIIANDESFKTNNFVYEE